jgi:hypothetical protein
MTMNIWIVAVLLLSLPSEYRLCANSSERAELLPGPPGFYATEEFRSWQTPDGKAFHLFFWVPRAPRDLGPMKVAAEWPVSVAGQDTKVLETSLFMGRKRSVLVTYLHFTNPEANAMLYASGLDLSEFRSLLSGVKVVATP